MFIFSRVNPLFMCKYEEIALTGIMNPGGMALEEFDEQDNKFNLKYI